ncbi:hypothetical protein EZS27_015311 [termite gut metagenome]|uniref:Uncharacterized protein n=1 Tax=termite gut metagenome TaxID=433724 RepID=A0A5J4RSI5_9ZZZZ
MKFEKKIVSDDVKRYVDVFNWKYFLLLPSQKRPLKLYIKFCSLLSSKKNTNTGGCTSEV